MGDSDRSTIGTSGLPTFPVLNQNSNMHRDRKNPRRRRGTCVSRGRPSISTTRAGEGSVRFVLHPIMLLTYSLLSRCSRWPSFRRGTRTRTPGRPTSFSRCRRRSSSTWLSRRDDRLRRYPCQLFCGAHSSRLFRPTGTEGKDSARGSARGAPSSPSSGRRRQP